jgi:probable rRNA maturation factor
MPFKIHVQTKQVALGGTTARVVREAARAALEHQGAPSPGELTLVIAGDAVLRRLNREFLGRADATDVLSFPAAEAGHKGARYLGDVAISLPRARAQAGAGGHPVNAELQLLVVHGVLHLLGHDHARPAEKARMWKAQADILRRLNAPILGPTNE